MKNYTQKAKDIANLANKSLRTNTKGHTQDGKINYELVRLGFSIDDIPKQYSFENKDFRKNFKYTKNTKIKPLINHDDGFSYDPNEKRTYKDTLQYIKWQAFVLAAERYRPDLIDALGAYRHFLHGNGSERTFSYERYIAADKSGRKTLESAIMHLKVGVEGIWLSDKSSNQFTVTSPVIACGSQDESNLDAHFFPYPETENWQKTIGSHYIWISATVNVVVDKNNTPHFYTLMTLHAEDKYNFNPGKVDVKTGIHDEENGRFTVIGMGHQYLHKSTITRSVSWIGYLDKNIKAIALERAWYARHKQPISTLRLEASL